MPQGKVFTRKKIATPPCRLACPAELDIPLYCSLISQGKYKEALHVIRERIPFPASLGRVCFSPCETSCHIVKIDDQPMMIKALKRFVGDMEVKNEISWHPRKSSNNLKSIAIIGSGPAGLTAAYFLSLRGYDVNIFEALSVAGGMLAVGIPDYRLPKSILQHEINVIINLGVKITLNSRVGKDITIDELKNKYAATFIAIGLHANKKLNIPGENLEGVIYGIDFLRQANLGENVFLGNRVAIVGGGNAAIDSARTALRTGSKDVVILYRRTRSEMPAYDEEIRDAEEEGIKFNFLTAPIRVLGNHEKLTGIECIRMELGIIESDGRRRPMVIKGSEFSLEVDALVPAIGQAIESSIIEETRINITQNGTIEVNPNTYATNIDSVFAGGDVVSGPASVIDAVAVGRKVAESIDRYLGGDGIFSVRDSAIENEPFLQNEWLPIGDRIGLDCLLPSERIDNFSEVYRGLSEEQAIIQAKRCLRCDFPIIVKSSECCGCLLCVLRCSFKEGGNFNLSTSKINVQRLVNAESEFKPLLSEECDNCGLCVRYCPYGALIRGIKEAI